MRLFTDVASTIPDPLLRRAFMLAEEGRGLTSPNPMVGCVIAQDDEIVGEGAHLGAGGQHAEVVALNQAGPRAAGATAYVTLEPCNHFGRTPPCSETLITRGVAHVVIGMGDPNPVAVGGAVRLREAGLEVDLAADPSPFESQNEEWLHFVRTGRPFVRVKTALTLDGRPARERGVRCAVSGEGGAELTMRLRAAADAVVVGGGTARSDDPALTVRDTGGTPADRQPLRVVLTRTGDVGSLSMSSDGLGEMVTLVTDDPGPRGLAEALAALAGRGVVSVLVEAGPGMLAAMLDSGAADEYVFVHAGWFAGPGAPGATEAALGSAETCVLRPLETGIIGSDAVTVWRPKTVGRD